MTEAELDEVYTETCRAMTDVGTANGELFLGRLTLLLMHAVGDAARVRQAIAQARAGMEQEAGA